MYRFRGTTKISPDDVFEGESSPDLTPSSPDLTPSFPDLSPSFPDLSSNILARDDFGRLKSKHFALSFIDDLEYLTADFRMSLEDLAAEPRKLKKINKDRMIEIVLQLCEGHFIRLDCLSQLVNRSPVTLQGEYLTRLCRDQRLRMAFQDNPTDPRKAYTKA